MNSPRPGVQAQAKEGHFVESTRVAPLAHGVRKGQTGALVVGAGAVRDRLAVRGEGPFHDHHARTLRGEQPGPFQAVHGSR